MPSPEKYFFDHRESRLACTGWLVLSCEILGKTHLAG